MTVMCTDAKTSADLQSAVFTCKGYIKMRNCKEAVVNEPVAITKAYGYINEWGPVYSERFRNRNTLFIGQADTTACALIMRMADGTVSPMFCLLHHWCEGANQHLDFSTSVEFSVDVEDFKPRWIFDGEEVDLTQLARTKNGEAANAARMVCSGVPALGVLAYKVHLIDEAFQNNRLYCNEPMLWVPRKEVDIATNSVEPFLSFICSGMGGIMTPTHVRVRELMRQAYGLTPWQMYANAGCSATVLMVDISKKAGMLGQLIKILADMIEHPLEMLAVDQRSLPKLLSKEQEQAFRKCVPWFVINQDEYEVPDHENCFLMARRMDTYQTRFKKHIPAEQLGFKMPVLDEFRQQMHPAETAPRQKPPKIVEVKPSAAVTSGTSES